MINSRRLEDLRAELERLERPSLAKTGPKSARERWEDQCARAYAAGFDASAVPEAEIARRAGVDRRVVRDWRSGSRAVPMWAIVALPRDGQVAALKVLVSSVPAEDDAERGAA